MARSGMEIKAVDILPHPRNATSNASKIGRVSAPEGDRIVIWDRVAGVRYLSAGRRRYIILTYQNGSERHLEPHQAIELWNDCETHKGCEAPCYYRHECETSPDNCTACKIAECLVGIECEVRPAPVGPIRRRQPDFKWLVILGLSLLVIVLAEALREVTHSPTPPRYVSKMPDAPPPARAKGLRGRVGEGKGSE